MAVVCVLLKRQREGHLHATVTTNNQPCGQKNTEQSIVEGWRWNHVKYNSITLLFLLLIPLEGHVQPAELAQQKARGMECVYQKVC